MGVFFAPYFLFKIKIYLRFMYKIYAQLPSSGSLILSEEESKHLCKVMRKTVGDRVLILDGKGKKATAKISIAHAKKAEVSILEIETTGRRSSIELNIAIAPTKNLNRIEYFVEKATEIGIDFIQPILCVQSERKVLKTDRLEKIAIAAMKQSGQVFLPKIAELLPVMEFVKNNPNGLIAYCPDHLTNPQLLNEVKNRDSIAILIGPEGDFTQEEVNFALENGYKTVSLGKSILRTETAGVYATTLISTLD